MYQISSKSDDCSLRYGDLTICNMAAVGHLEFSKFRTPVTWPLSPCYSASLCKISLKSENRVLSYGQFFLQITQLSQTDRAMASCYWIFRQVTQDHSRSFEMTLLSRACVSPYLVPFLRYSTSHNGVTLKLGVAVVRGRWKWHRSVDHYTTYYWSAIISIALSCTIFKLSWPWNLG